MINHPSEWRPAYERDPERYARLGALYKDQAEAKAAARNAALDAWDAEVARQKADDAARAAEAKAAEDRAAAARLANTLSVMKAIGLALLVAVVLYMLGMIAGHGP